MSLVALARNFRAFRTHVRQQKAAGRKVVALEFPQASHISYFAPLMSFLRSQAPGVAMIVMYNSALPARALLGENLARHGFGDLFVTDRWNVASGVDLYLSSNQFTSGMPGTHSVCFFHGQPSKGITFSRSALDAFDSYFFYGPLHRRALEGYFARHGGRGGYCPRIVETGYPKLDALLNGAYSRRDILNALALDPARKTVLYAPAFNEFASLRTAGKEIVRTLAALRDFNVLIKLAAHSVENTSSDYSTGGVDWLAALRPFESDRVKVVVEADINPYLAAADIMVTDISGVAYDFLALDKPVIFYDCPEFYARHAARFDAHLDPARCLADDAINAGRNHGLVVRNCQELAATVDALGRNEDPSASGRRDLAQKILYHPGRATEVAGAELVRLIESGARARKPHRSVVLDTWLPQAARWALTPAYRSVRRLMTS